MKTTIALTICLFVTFCKAHTQTYQWTATNSPVPFVRFQDVYFLNPDTGFAINLYAINQPGFIAKTTDGGDTWTKVVDSSLCLFRAIGFTDAAHGWVGTVYHSNTGVDTSMIYSTNDGGTTWKGESNFPGPSDAGICGLKVINDSTIYGVGRYSGPAGFYKTSNYGQTWQYTNLDSLAGGLVDLHFFDPDTGIAVGSSSPNYFNGGHGRVLYTTDAGNTWRIVYTSQADEATAWKVVFPSRNVGYSSLEIHSNPATYHFMKTTNGGITWQELPHIGNSAQGIGFLNDSVGWLGSNKIYFTRDGGTTWTEETWGSSLNRFRFLSDTVGYSTGQKVYKMHLSPTGIIEQGESNRDGMKAYPNPAKDFAYFEFYLDKAVQVKLAAYDLSGKEVALIFDKPYDRGIHHSVWQPENLPPGVYFCHLSFGNKIMKQKLEILK
ncbi:MAG: T9SS type A sorting domain-containing protein [Bacteroidota bacterium]